jgi:hypothetical protein
VESQGWWEGHLKKPKGMQQKKQFLLNNASCTWATFREPNLQAMFKLIEKWINERGSAKILEQRLALKDDEIAALKTNIENLKFALQQKKVEVEEIRLPKGIEFRRGKVTADKWAAFCPSCHMPAEYAWTNRGTSKVVICSERCGWKVFMNQKLIDLVGELET